MYVVNKHNNDRVAGDVYLVSLQAGRWGLTRPGDENCRLVAESLRDAR